MPRKESNTFRHYLDARYHFPKCFETTNGSLESASGSRVARGSVVRHPCIRQFLNKKFFEHSKTQTQTCNHFTFKLPYLGNVSHNIEKKLQQFIKKQLPHSKLRFIHTTTKLKHYFHIKDSQSSTSGKEQKLRSSLPQMPSFPTKIK